MGIRLMKPVVHGRQPGSKNYTKEFREAVAAEANDPNRSIAEVARAHGLNANMVAQWRRSLLDSKRAIKAVLTARRYGCWQVPGRTICGGNTGVSTQASAVGKVVGEGDGSAYRMGTAFAAAGRCGATFHGSSSSMRFAGWSAMRSMT
ncbi:transposase [Paraburkholderia kururiensis]|uniref:transposase n=1 Tax=Paraburkholderia kururiensis TaxID=984307 RepID=UPI0039A60A52